MQIAGMPASATPQRRISDPAPRRKGQRSTIAEGPFRSNDRARDHLSKADTVTGAAIEAGVPTLVDARKLIDRFHTMVRKRIEADLDPWIEAASQSLVASFESGVSNDKTSVHAALVQPWSNGQTEGQISKLKLVKRQMYGRAKIDLLQARLIGAS
jgi:transposase